MSENPNGYVSIKELAATLGLERSNVLKMVKRLGYPVHKQRSPGSRGQYYFALTEADAEELVAKRREEGPIGSSPDAGMRSDFGVFYIIQLVPDLSPNRIKLGFATSIDERTRSHRTAAPTAEVFATWPCRRTWELAAIDSISREGCKSLSGEAFDCDDLDQLRSRADQFFGLMPPV